MGTPLQRCSDIDGDTSGVRYSVQPFTVTSSGSYSVYSEQLGWDGYIYFYEGLFDPANPLTGCIDSNDDYTGVGTSLIEDLALVAGQNYSIVTTGYSTNSRGSFTNQVEGPGQVTLLPTDRVSIDKSLPDGLPLGGQYRYLLTASAHADATAVVVSDPLPSGIQYIGNDCGATLAGNTLTWTLGTMAASSSASCVVTMVNPATQCAVVSNTATIATADIEYTLANNTATAANRGDNAVPDFSFEADLASSPWRGTSPSAATPICTFETCPYGWAPNTGEAWVEFGNEDPGAASIEQTLVIPANASEVSFWLDIQGCAYDVSSLRLLIDGQEIWRADDEEFYCNIGGFGGGGGYQQRHVALDGYADGGSHVLRFEALTDSGGKGGVTILLDDVFIESPPVCITSSTPYSYTAVPSNGWFGLIVLLGLLAGIGALRIRQTV